MSRIFITGDTHGDFSRFNPNEFPAQSSLTKDDFMIICGDFGGVWDGHVTEQRILDWLEARPFTTLFVSGNHENFDLLKKYPIEIWHGGKVQRIRPHVIHLMRGQIFDLHGKTFFTMGGARSHDIDAGILEPDDPNFRALQKKLDRENALYRVNHVSWWKEELPSAEEYAEARQTLARAGWKVDGILTHCAPTSIQAKIDPMYHADPLTDFLEEVRMQCTFEAWFFGHYHEDFSIDDKFHLLYDTAIEV